MQVQCKFSASLVQSSASPVWSSVSAVQSSVHVHVQCRQVQTQSRASTVHAVLVAQVWPMDWGDGGHRNKTPYYHLWLNQDIIVFYLIH